MSRSLIKRVLDWVLFAMAIVYLFTGLGITQFRIIEGLTFGVLSRNLPFRLHEDLLVPFLVLLSLHVFYRPIRWVYLTIVRARLNEKLTLQK